MKSGAHIKKNGWVEEVGERKMTGVLWSRSSSRACVSSAVKVNVVDFDYRVVRGGSQQGSAE